ncbi:TMEM175 family protein [Lactobacillus sp. YT155]|uniref:TMEM175 family protein n=1 Tax=Lactobacillus sp. YT155 TaxID=3060955 RepID=UPI00265F9E8B|nr:TMEM175 family protein [Lactobacillus sp. YT155]MDO1604861.1 TMEM175 family protein [Lactobacillus sp. YT155]
MNKSRVEAFTDAVIAIILTIMILEFKTPESVKLSALLPQIPYLISYMVGYLFIGVAWYNHHYMFSKVHVVTKEIFWLNLVWMFSTSFIPVATAWVSRGLNDRGPEIFYGIIYLLWTISYLLLTHKIILSEERYGHQKSADDVKRMKIYRVFSNWKVIILSLIIWILIIVFLPVAQLLAVTIMIVFIGASFNEDSDQLFIGEKNED